MNHWLFGLLQALRKPHILVCVLVLAVAAGGLHAAAVRMKAHFRKEPAYLKRPFDDLNEERLWPYRVVPDGKRTLPPEVTEELGTRQYLEWVLKAEGPLTEGPPFTGQYHVLVTYYTGQPDQVPHIPDRCQIAAGYSPAGSKRLNMELDYHGQKMPVPLRMSTFSKKTRLGSDARTVFYTFFVNGQFEEERTRVRLRLGRIGERYAFYSKVEVSLHPSPPGERAAKVSQAFLHKLLPVLLEDHWPDWPIPEQT